MKRLLVIALIIAAPAVAGADPTRQQYKLHGEVATAVALDAASTTFAINLEGAVRGVFGLMDVFVKITDTDNSTTAITMTCTGSHDGGTTDYTLQDCVGASGVYTCTNLSWVKDPSGITSPKKWVWRVDIEGLSEIECTFTDTGGAAADSLDVTIAFAVKG